MTLHIAFIGGGNMASALMGGLLKPSQPHIHLQVVEPSEPTRQRLQEQFNIQAQASASATLEQAEVVIWAVKPQTFREAANAVQPYTHNALHLSVAAGICTDSMVNWLGSERIVRAMPNTPALVGLGMTGLFSRPVVSQTERQQIESILRSTGELLWVQRESDLDAVTALSGSGPAYVFYFLEAMIAAGVDMGLPLEQAQHLAQSTFTGATELARRSTEPAQELRQRVTSKGGTTAAALNWMEQHHLQQHFIQAMQQARQRAIELGHEFGKA